MRRNEPGDNKVQRALPLVHPNAAAIDVGARMHVAAVGADRTAEPVRRFGTFTTDLHRLVDWFAECGIETVVMEGPVSTGSRFSNCLRRAGLWYSSSMHAMPSMCRDARWR